MVVRDINLVLILNLALLLTRQPVIDISTLRNHQKQAQVEIEYLSLYGSHSRAWDNCCKSPRVVEMPYLEDSTDMNLRNKAGWIRDLQTFEECINFFHRL